MGFRFRKSKNFGAFRVNMSKSGLGYSVGGKGFRITRKANGGSRTTLSVPGTGLSYVSDSKKSKKHTSNKSKVKSQNNSSSVGYEEEQGDLLYDNEKQDVSQLVNSNTQELVDEINHFLSVEFILAGAAIVSLIAGFFLPLFLVLTIFLSIGEIVFIMTQKVELEYEYDDYGRAQSEKIKDILEALRKNDKLWQMLTLTTTTSAKTHAGAEASIKRKPIRISKGKPIFIKTDATCYKCSFDKHTLYLLPDRIIVTSGAKAGVVEYDELKLSSTETIFVESESVPRDAEVVGKTWKYVNKNGKPDKRFKDNKQIPQCRYGIVDIESTTGLDLIILASSINTVLEFEKLIENNTSISIETKHA